MLTATAMAFYNEEMTKLYYMITFLNGGLIKINVAWRWDWFPFTTIATKVIANTLWILRMKALR
jgi:hypothetical protein